MPFHIFMKYHIAKFFVDEKLCILPAQGYANNFGINYFFLTQIKIIFLVFRTMLNGTDLAIKFLAGYHQIAKIGKLAPCFKKNAIW